MDPESERERRNADDLPTSTAPFLRVRDRVGGLHPDLSPKRKRVGVFQETRPLAQTPARLRLGLGLSGPA